MKTRLLSGRRRWRVALLILNALGQASAALAAAFCIKLLFDGLMATGSTAGPTWLLAGGFVAATLTAAGLKILERVEAEALGFDYTADIRVELFDRIGELSPRALSSRNEGTVLVRFVGDLTALKQWVSQGLIRLSVAGVLLACLLLAISVLNWRLALGLAALTAVGAAGAWLLSAPLKRAVRKARRRRALLSGFIAERVQAMSTLRSLGGLTRERRRVLRRSEKARQASLERAAAGGAMVALVQATFGAATLLTLLIGASQLARGTTPGDVVGALTLLGALVGSLTGLGRVVEYWHAAQSSREKIEELLNAGPDGPVEAPRALSPSPGPAALVFENVSLPGVLEPFTATARPGQVIAVRGASGVGKSTLLQLAARLIAPAEGRILLGGEDIAALTMQEFRKAVGLVSPEAPLLRGSLRMNLRYRRPDASQEEVDRVVALCGIDTLLKTAPEGERLRISERGRNLSAGERQRVMLARALIGSPQLLLLDEADANLDERTADALAEVLKSYQGVVLMITRRGTWLAQADARWRIRRDGVVQTPARGKASAGEAVQARGKVERVA